MLEDWKESTLLIRMTKHTRNTFKHARRKLVKLVEAAMPCKKEIPATGSWLRRWLQGSKDNFMVVKWEPSLLQKTRRPHCRQRICFDGPLQFGSHIYSDSTSDENAGCKSSSGQGMEEGRDNASMPTGESQTKKKKEAFLEAQRDKKKVHFAPLMNTYHFKKTRSWNPNYRGIQGRVVLRGDIVKDDSGAYAVFTEQGSWASQMTAAKVMDVIARLPDCDGQAADAVSAHTQVKLEGHLLVAQKSQIGMSRCLDTSSLAGLLWEWQIEEILLEFGRQKSTL